LKQREKDATAGSQLTVGHTMKKAVCSASGPVPGFNEASMLFVLLAAE
jgi:hypothetical protein